MRHAERAKAGYVVPSLPVVISADMRTSLEAARLDLLALFRALDQMDLTAGEIPQSVLRQLFELDADYAEALWALDQPPGRFKLRSMLRDTSVALERMPQLLAKFRKCCRRGPTPNYPRWSGWFVRI